MPPFKRALLALPSASPDRQTAYDQKNVRTFVAGNRYGPLLGLALAGFLLLLGFPADYRFIGYVGLLCLFWIYPPLVARGLNYVALCFCSLQQLCLLIVWASHGYGGMASPFVMWLAVVPLLAFLHFSPSLRMWLLLVGLVALNVLVAAAASLVVAPPPVEPAKLHGIALVSIVGAAIYVSMMAIHFGQLLDSRGVAEQEAERHLAVLAALHRQADRLGAAREARTTVIDKVGREAQAPITEIDAACAQLRQSAASGESVAIADLDSIAEAARFLTELVRDVERYASLEAGPGRIELAACDLDSLLTNAAAQAQEALRSAEIEVEVGSGATVWTDRALVEGAIVQVLRHIGRLGLHGRLKLRGAGLPAGQGDHVVIDAFRAEEDSPGALRSGDSLGLALADRMLVAIGGSIGQHPGRPDGSHFRIELPAARAT